MEDDDMGPTTTLEDLESGIANLRHDLVVLTVFIAVAFLLLGYYLKH